MGWIRNPFVSPSSSSAQGRLSESENRMLRDAEAGGEKKTESAVSTGNALLAPRTPTDRLSTHQFVYLSIMHGLGALVVSGGINFAVSYGMYTTQDTSLHPIRLFELPNTLAGDAAVTIVLQCIITWLLEFVMVTGDLRNGKLAPIGFVAPPTNRFLRWFMFLDAQQKAVKPGRVGHWSPFLAAHALRGFLVALPAFVLLWGPAVGILTAVGTQNGGDWDFTNKWAPEIFKLILGGVLGLLATPPMATFWMVRAGWPVGKTDG